MIPRETRKITELREWDKNPRSITKEAFQSLIGKIKRWGQFKPVLITQDGEIIGGNMRIKAYRELGIVDIWVSVLEPKSEAEKIEIAMADNELAGRWDDQALAELIEPFKLEINLKDYELDMGKPMLLSDLIDQFGPEPEEDEAPEVSTETPDSKLGEIYQLGKHRLICGDATKIEDVEKLMDGKKADMIFTDPPYNVDYEGKTKDALKIENDKMGDETFYKFLLDSMSNMSAVSKPGAGIYICHADSEGLNFRKAMVESGFLFKQCIIWNKNSMVMGRQDYQWKHEPILYGWKDGGSHYFVDDRTQTTVWDINRPSKSTDHPNQQTIQL